MPVLWLSGVRSTSHVLYEYGTYFSRGCAAMSAAGGSCLRLMPRDGGRSDCGPDSPTGLAPLLVERPCPGEILVAVNSHAGSFEHHCVDAGCAISRGPEFAKFEIWTAAACLRILATTLC